MRRSGRIGQMVGVVAVAMAVAWGVWAPVLAGTHDALDGMLQEARSAVRTVTLAESKALWERGGVLFLDCRTESEFKAGHIRGAVHMPRGRVEFLCEHLLPGKDVLYVLYAAGRGRELLAARTLYEMGYRGGVVMTAGWEAWAEAGYPRRP